MPDGACKPGILGHEGNEVRDVSVGKFWGPPMSLREPKQKQAEIPGIIRMVSVERVENFQVATDFEVIYIDSGLRLERGNKLLVNLLACLRQREAVMVQSDWAVRYVIYGVCVNVVAIHRIAEFYDI